MSFDHAHFEGPVFLVSFVPSGSYIHSASSPTGFAELRGDKLVETSHLLLSVPVSLTVYIISDGGYLYLFSFVMEGRVFDDG